MQKAFVLFLILLLPAGYASAFNIVPARDFYQIKIYHLKNEEQEKKVEKFLEQAYLPALHRAGIIDVGVFKPIQTPDAKKQDDGEKQIYVFIPLSSYKNLDKLEKDLQKDQKFLSDGKAYIDAPYNDPPYERMETILLNAFEKSPHYAMPKLAGPKAERVYELRSYESHTEKISRNKVQMFNKGDEIGLFKRLGFNAVFYAEVIAGNRMPNLMYLTTFENKADRDAHWKSFLTDEYWKKLSSMPEYRNNVSKNDIKFLYPTNYSDI